MKQLLLFAAILASTIAHCQYIPMLLEGNTWSVDTHYSTFVGDKYTITHQFEIGNDIFLNGETYKIVIVDGVESCYVREENGLLFRYFDLTQTELLLYDFHIEVGDIFEIYDPDIPKCSYMFNYYLPPSTVLATYNAPFAGESRKVIELDFFNFFAGQEIFIEGIGSLRGFDPMGVGEEDNVYATNLVCFSTNGQSYFFNDATSCDNTTLSLVDVSEEEVILYPNPIVQKSILQLPYKGYADTMQIYNLNGNLVKEVVQSTDHFIIDAMKYRSGMYFYQVLFKNRVLVSNNFIIQ